MHLLYEEHVFNVCIKIQFDILKSKKCQGHTRERSLITEFLSSLALSLNINFYDLLIYLLLVKIMWSRQHAETCRGKNDVIKRTPAVPYVKVS